MAKLAVTLTFYLAAAGILFWLDLRMFSLALLLFFIGGTLNFIVMAANGGRMPVRIIDEFIYEKIIQSKEHCFLTEKTRLPWLADIFDCIFWIVSIGDIIITVGQAMYFIAWVMLFGRLIFWLLRVLWVLFL
jgi:hypothetical protein